MERQKTTKTTTIIFALVVSFCYTSPVKYLTFTGAAMLDQLNRINLLFDIYAPLLTERQQETLRLYFSDNFSLAEIASEYMVSRQAIHDLIHRSLDALEKFESKLGLYQLFNEQQDLLSEAEEIVSAGEFDKMQHDRLKEIIYALKSGNEQ